MTVIGTYSSRASYRPMSAIRIGTAGWSVPRKYRSVFADAETGLERYASKFNAVEINSSFYRSHRASTWTRWRDNTPSDFRFSVKMPKAITHEHGLIGCSELIERFLDEVAGLEERLGVLLVQLPPKRSFDADASQSFFDQLNSRTSIPVACEPRHASWFTGDVERFLIRNRIALVGADPAICPAAARPTGWTGLRYWRLHGSPAMYRSNYAERLPTYAADLNADGTAGPSWCIFDNTASGAATGDALALSEMLAHAPATAG